MGTVRRDFQAKQIFDYIRKQKQNKILITRSEQLIRRRRTRINQAINSNIHQHPNPFLSCTTKSVNDSPNTPGTHPHNPQKVESIMQ